MSQVRLILGSTTDEDKAIKITEIWNELEVHYQTSVASCHWHSGDGFAEFVKSLKEEIIVFLGGMSFQAPDIAKSILKNSGKFLPVIGIPTDEAARSAIEDLPKGTGILTTGLNQISLSHSLENAALTIAELVALVYRDDRIYANLKNYHREQKEGDKKIESDFFP